MTSTMKQLIMAILAAAVLAGCKGSIDYREAKNYFFRNDAEIPASPLVETQAEFDSLFGMATTMGPDGKPTAIDFDKEFVIAVVPGETNRPTTIEPKELYKAGDSLVFSYKLNQKDEDQGYTTQPIFIAIVSRDHYAPKAVLHEE